MFIAEQGNILHKFANLNFHTHYVYHSNFLSNIHLQANILCIKINGQQKNTLLTKALNKMKKFQILGVLANLEFDQAQIPKKATVNWSHD